MVEKQEMGVWLIRMVTASPDNERWGHEAQAIVELARDKTWST